MQIKQILQARANRNSRLSQPFFVLLETLIQCTDAAQSILDGKCDPKFAPLLERSVVISAVTSIEVFYRDMLDILFSYCSPSFYESHLKSLHPEKYDISEILDIVQHEIHPLEIVSNAQSFQSVDKIDKVFSRFVGKSLWSSVLELKVEFNSTLDSNEETWGDVKWNSEDIASLKAIFDLRHELVHDPARRNFITAETIANIWKSGGMVWGSELVLTKLIEENKDPKYDLPSAEDQSQENSGKRRMIDGEKFFHHIFEYFRIPGFTLTSLRALQTIVGEKVWYKFLGATSDFILTNQALPGKKGNSLLCIPVRKGIIIEDEKRPDFVKTLNKFVSEFSKFSELPKEQQIIILEKFVLNKDAFIIRMHSQRIKSVHL